MISQQPWDSRLSLAFYKTYLSLCVQFWSLRIGSMHRAMAQHQLFEMNYVDRIYFMNECAKPEGGKTGNGEEWRGLGAPHQDGSRIHFRMKPSYLGRAGVVSAFGIHASLGGGPLARRSGSKRV